MAKLQRCIYCGGEARIMAPQENKDVSRVECKSCGIGASFYTDTEAATESWNNMNCEVPF